MKKPHHLFIGLFALFCSFSSSSNGKINWKKITTSQDAWTAMSTLIHSGDLIQDDYAILMKQKHSFIQMNGDSIIYFHSPEKAVHFGAMVVRKWMFTITYANARMKDFVVESGLTGP